MRTQKFCYHHSRNRAGHERTQAQDGMLQRLSARIDAMSTPELLYFLYSQLSRLNKTLNRFPDIHVTLVAALGRISEIDRMESRLKHQVHQNHELMTRITQSQMNSVIWPQDSRNQ